MRWTGLMIGFLAAVLGGCTHLKGVVVEDPGGRPMRTAVLTVGRPGGIAVFERHPVDDRGRFEFSLSPADLSNVYLYDGATAPEATLRHVDESEFSDHMQLHIRRARPGNPMLPTDININQ
ncbi:MAG TPA: hypothetical protein VHM90_02565 [Phycisphaerae bacterium]|nr:hypothetical protein [Phycisphaerae bacterium]